MLRDSRGTSLVEFAIALPFLVMLALGIIEIGRYVTYSVLVANSVRAGAQAGAGLAAAQQTPDPNESPGANLDTRASQAACIDAYHDLGVSDSTFSCTSTGASVPTNGLKINSSVTCFLNGVAAKCSTSQPAPAGQSMYLTVAATGKFTSLLKYPFLPNNVPVSAQTTVRISQ